MIKFLIVAVIVFDIYAFIDCAMTPQEKIRKGPKWAWLIAMLLTETLGAVLWFIYGRPKRNGNGRQKPGRIIPPDDNPDFLRKL
ncbi:MAG: PLD nuclease N-terminal domain-containing protein [Actinomycetes bacterium]|jgi:hypothetical protein